VTSTTSISCTLPYLSTVVNASYVFYGSYVSTQVSFSSGSSLSNNLNVPVYSYPNAPTITSVSGCQRSNSALSVSGCSSTSVLTVTGTNLYNTTNPGPWGSFVNPVTNGNTFPSWSCTVTSSTATQLVCEMPVFDAFVSPVQVGVTYNMTVNSMNVVNGWYVSGNAFAVDFTPSSSSSSGLSTGKIVAIAILVPVAAIVLAVALFVCYSRCGGMKLSMPKMPAMSSKGTSFGKHVDESGGGSDAQDVEMESSEAHA